MGTLENESRRRTRRGQIERALLTSLAIVGVGLVAIAAPNTVKLLKHIDPYWLSKRDPRERLRVVASRLKNKGLVSFEREGGRMKMRITPKGRQILERVALSERRPIRPKRWDGKWRIVIFDIPEKQRALRGRVREHVRAFGFKKLQGSVWIYPHDCEDLITLLKAELRIGRNLLYIIADAVEFDAPIRGMFNLPLPGK